MGPLDIIRNNTETLIGEDELDERLRSGRLLRAKLGVDPTRPDLTFGHLVVFNKLRQFQDLGHTAVLIIGDYTAAIGDPSGRSALRPALSESAIKANAETYLDQAFLVLDRNKTEVRFNSEWFGKMNFSDALGLARKMTVARMLERDDFAKRHRENTPISIVEFLYPLVQGYDSIMVEADIELGGSDQLFNMLVGRALQKDAGQPEQAVLTMPLLVGLDGAKKMSKSLDNYIAFTDLPKEMFGKVMSIPDSTMCDYYRLLLNMDEAVIEKHRREQHPMEAKKHLAASLVGRFHSLEAAQHEQAQFEQVFSRNELPDDMPVISWADSDFRATETHVNIIATGLSEMSKKEIKRLLEQGAVRLNDEVQSKDSPTITAPADAHIFQVGKRKFFRVIP